MSKTWDLSGMGGGYEEMCQRMLWRGVAYLAEVKPPVEMWTKASSFKNVYGLMATEGADLKGLEDAIIRPGDDGTRAMHQCVMGHLAYIHKHGLDAWHDELAKHRAPEKSFDHEEADWTREQCAQIAEKMGVTGKYIAKEIRDRRPYEYKIPNRRSAPEGT